jgi:tRNA-dihydrouridine synthase B
MKIANCDLGNKLFLAPMADVTDSAFRKISVEHGAGLTFTQMISALGIIENEFESLRYLTFNQKEKPIGVQLLGSNIDIIKEAVKEVSKLKPDLIDLNCGCSVDKVTNYNFGSALLDDPKLIGKLVNAMVNSSNGIPISIKIRLGKDKDHINVLEAAKAAEENGASVIFVHARMRNDKYSAEVQIDWIKKVKDELKIPVVGNGSVFTPSDAKKMIDSTGCDSVMVARGALGNPFIFQRYNEMMKTGNDPGEPEIETAIEVLLKHIELVVKDYGDINSFDKVKKLAIWYLKNYPGIDNFLEKVFAVTNVDELINLINAHTGDIKSKKFKLIEKSKIQNKFKERVLFWLVDNKQESVN